VRPLRYESTDLAAAAQNLDPSTRDALTTMARQIEQFAQAQRAALTDIDVTVPGGRAGHTVVPMARAGCYAPAGRFPLPSSVMMTVVTARAAGVGDITLATPSTSPLMLAAAAIAGATRVIAVGGAQAIAALAYGTETLAACDVVVGPGNRWVTAAKKVVAGDVAIDFLAGPSELVVLADRDTDPAMVAADLLAQAEHDPDALPILVALDEALVDRIDGELRRQLATLSTAATATAALANGFAVCCTDLDEAIAVINQIAPEHLELTTAGAREIASRVVNAGGIFIGAGAAEVFGDYGVGPNHVLPTGAAARFTGGLSVMTFLRLRTWLETTEPDEVVPQVAVLARLEGLEGHARAAEVRLR
jgi:phosphoribosyl-ATP pyrophosphohydrolase/phosphoribosyl-AMP cyclohydrolase/histidinol dehydrogenase